MQQPPMGDGTHSVELTTCKLVELIDGKAVEYGARYGFYGGLH